MDDTHTPSDPESIHAEMLRHLETHPPPLPADPLPASASVRPHPTQRSEPPRPVLMLRRLRLELALDRLEHFVRVHHRRGSHELLVIAGRGRNSRGEPVLGPAVREWCEKRPDLVAEVTEAPQGSGGAGAMVVRLTRW